MVYLKDLLLFFQFILIMIYQENEHTICLYVVFVFVFLNDLI